ncbi:uS2m family ribosomal protein [Candidatus Vidania fulgoroideorum]
MINILKEIELNKLNIGHNLNNYDPITKKYKEKIYNNICYIKKTRILAEIKKLFFFLTMFYKKKRVSLFVDTNKNHSDIIKKFFKKINFYFVINKWKNGSITNFNRVIKNYKKNNGNIFKMNKNPDIIFITDPVKNFSIVKEANKKNIKIVVFSDSHYPYKNIDYYIPMNNDSEKSIIFFLRQLYFLLKKITIKYYYKNNNSIFIINKKYKKDIVFIKIKTINSLINKKYFIYKIKKVFKILKKNKNKNEIKNIFIYLSNFYNEKIFFLGYKIKKICNFFNYNNKKIVLVYSKKNKNLQELMMHIISMHKKILENTFYKKFINNFYKNMYDYIKKSGDKIKKIYLMR